MEVQEDKKDSSGTGLFCPWCGNKIPEDSVYCEFCGKQVMDSPKAVKKGKGRRRLLYAGAAVLLVIAAALILNRGNGTAEGKFFYIKDNSMYERGSKSGTATELTANYLENWNKKSAGGLLTGKSKEDASGVKIPTYSPSGRYLFFLERGVKGSFDLVRKDLKRNETKVLDSGVTEFLPVGEGLVVYKKEKGALYCFNHTRKEKLSENVTYYKINKSGDRLLWATEEDGTRDIYLSGFSKKDEKIRLERNAELLDAAPDFSTFLIKKEDTVFKIDRNGKKEKLMEGGERAMLADAQTDRFYFTRTMGDGPADSYKELYYYSSGEPKLLYDSFKELIWQGEEAFLFTQTDDSNTTMLATAGSIFDLGVEIALEEQIAVKGNQLYFLSPDEPDSRTGRPEYELCAVSLKGSEQGHVMVIDKGVSEIAYISDTQAYYYKDPEEGIADLYCNGERVAYDVAAGSVTGIPSGGNILCIADASSTGRRGTLYLVSGNEITAVTDSVVAYSMVSEREIYILSDYNRAKGRGDLKLYDGSTVTTLETDIWGFFEAGSSGSYR